MENDPVQADKPEENSGPTNIPNEASDSSTSKVEQPVVAAEAPKEIPEKPKLSSNKFKLLKDKLLSNKKLRIIIPVVVVLLAILFALPYTRYKILGTFIKETYNVKVLDSTTSNPVTEATVNLAGSIVNTNNQGLASIKAGVGNRQLSISKEYYSSYTKQILVPLSHKGAVTYKLVATGRQVQIQLTNYISQSLINNALISAGDAQARTNSKGMAYIVLPADKTKVTATITASGYNNSPVTITVSAVRTSANDFNLTPSGKIYFLSKLSGKIDVVKTNLDGTDRQTVLAGTGYEDDNNTVLLASRDWKYLALETIRSGVNGNPELDLIDTTNNDKVTNIDQGNVSFTLVGWDNDYFIYIVNRTGFNSWQSGAASLKSYNAQNGSLAVLDSTNATGSSNSDAQYESYTGSPLVLGNTIVFAKNWYAYPGYLTVPGKQNTLLTINADNTGKKTVSTIDASDQYFSIYPDLPQQAIIGVTKNTEGTTSYYNINSSGSYTASYNVNTNDLYNYPTYLVSPSGNSTFWVEPRDGKNTLLVGDQNAGSPKTIMTLSDYNSYGWYTDNYLLVSKNSSELYITPANGGLGPVALKITDYHKPAQNFNGYGGGYGGR